MLTKLFDFCITILEFFKFWAITAEYEKGLILRLGKYHRTLPSGLSWIAPFYIDKPIQEDAVLATTNLNSQSLVTSDGVAVVVSGVISHSISDIKQYVLRCVEGDDALVDVCYGLISEYVLGSSWETLRTQRFRLELKEEIQKKAGKFGIRVLDFRFSDLTRSKTLRIIGDATTAEMGE